VERSDTADEMELVTYREFGEQFFTHVVTEQRVLDAVNTLAQPIDFGPVGVGPGRLVKLTAHGAIGDARSEPLVGDGLVAYRMTLPVDVAFAVDLGMDVHRFDATLEVPLLISARAVAGLKILIDVQPPTAREVTTRLRAEGMRASVLQRVAGVEGEVRRFVSTYVARELGKPYVREALLIDIGAQVDRAWAGIAPRSTSPTAEHIGGDLREAIAEEIDASAAASPDGDGAPGVVAEAQGSRT
jgi:hypothetical protein